MTQRKTWFKVNAPKAWRPKPGDELVGSYLSSKIRSGQFGDYRVHFIKCRTQVYYVSGTQINDLFALVQENMKVKLVFVGLKQGKDHEYKVFDLYTEEAIELKIAEAS